jgi:hypothetical protein
MTQKYTSHTHILDQEPNVVQAHVSENRALLEAALTKEQDLLRRLFPSEEGCLIREHERESLKAGFEYRRRALHMAVEAKLQVIEEMCNHVLVTSKSEIRRQRQEFFAEQRLRLEQAMNACADRFNAEMERRLETLSRYQHPHLRQREEERLLKTIDQFQDMLEQLGREFMDIIQEGVSR